MGVIDDIYLEINKQNQLEQDQLEKIFKFFNVEMTKTNQLVLPERFRATIGERFDRIKFSNLIENGTAYVIVKPIDSLFEFGTFTPPYKTKGD